MDFEKSLQEIIFELLCDSKHMFYGLYLAELNKSFEKNFPTACVAKHRDSSNIMLVLGEHFWEKTLWNNSRKKAILIHELEHVIREHLSEISDGMFPDKKIANIAMDVSINQCITEELPKIDEKGDKCGVYIEDFPEMKLERDKSSLYYYQKFMEGKDKKEKCKGSQDSKNPCEKKGNKRGTSGSQTLDQILDNMEDGKLGDWHDRWDEITKGMGEKERDLLKKEIQESLRRVAEETEKMRGTVPMHISNALKDNFGNTPPVLSWKTLFNRFIGSTLTTDIYQTRKRPNFRFEDAPTNRYKNKIRIVCGCDTSGSVGENELKEFFGQIKHMWKAGVTVDICLWDAHCDPPYKYNGENTYSRTKCGGTQASCFTEYVNENKHKYNWTCAIGLTDGYVENEVTDCKLPMIWVITPSGSTEFKNKGKKIKIN